MGEPDSPTTSGAPASPSDLRMVRSEVNFLTYPFFCLDNRWHTDRLKIEYHRTLDRGEGREEISWRVLAHQEYGLPGPFDWALHKAIEEIINERGFPVRNPIPFSMRELCRRMGISYAGSKTIAEIKAAFLRITSTMVESKRTFYSKPKKRWIEDNFHLYDRVVYRGDELPDSAVPADTNYLFLGSWYLENLNALYVSLLDPHYRRSLSVAFARRLYEILGVKFYGLRAPKAPGLRYAYSTVCALLPVTRHRYFSQAHRQLDPAHQELIATGFLERVEWQTVAGTPPEWYLLYVPGPPTRCSPPRLAAAARSHAATTGSVTEVRWPLARPIPPGGTGVPDIPPGADTSRLASERPLSRLARVGFARHPQGLALTVRGRGGARLPVGAGGFLAPGRPLGGSGSAGAARSQRKPRGVCGWSARTGTAPGGRGAKAQQGAARGPWKATQEPATRARRPALRAARERSDQAGVWGR